MAFGISTPPPFPADKLDVIRNDRQGLRAYALASMRNYKQQGSLEFRALISECVEHLELVKA